MTALDADLREFVRVVAQLLEKHADEVDDASGRDGLAEALGSAGVLTLAVETFGMDDSLRWLAEVVARVAQSSPSLAFALACRYAAQRALGRADESQLGVLSTIAVASSPADSGMRQALIPRRLDPDVAVVIDAEEEQSAYTVACSALMLVPDAPGRSGLADAEIEAVALPEETPLTLAAGAARSLRREWCILVASASLGTAEAAVRASRGYASERRQFGAELISFAGLRALVAEMVLQVRATRALLDHGIDDPDDPDGPFALATYAGRAAVAVALTAIQVHGGYGYIDEYPVASLLRDALSLQARGLPRRTGLAILGRPRGQATV